MAAAPSTRGVRRRQAPERHAARRGARVEPAPVRRVALGALGDLQRPGGIELAAVVFAGVLLAAVALAGGSRATGGVPPVGIAFGVERAVSGPGSTTILTVTVANPLDQPFAGTITASGGTGRARTPIDVPASASGSVQLSIATKCGTPVQLVLAGANGPVRQAVATAPCAGDGAG